LAVEIDIDWSLVPSDAIAAVQAYIKKLVGELDSTTLKDFEQALIIWLESGGTVEDLKRQLATIFNDPARAEIIAVTEASNAYINGAIQRWDDAGVEQVRFMTVRDTHVCPICEALAGKVATVPELRVNNELPPVHARCRCFLRPVL